MDQKSGLFCRPLAFASFFFDPTLFPFMWAATIVVDWIAEENAEPSREKEGEEEKKEDEEEEKKEEEEEAGEEEGKTEEELIEEIAAA